MSNYSVELMEDEEKWNDNVERSPMSSIFHKWEFLKVVEKHTSSQLHTLIGYKGQEPIGLFPIFEIKKGPISTVFSPPPEVGVPFIGPILMNYDDLKQKKIESRNKSFVEKSLEFISDNISPSYTSITTTPEYDDGRPFSWNDLNVSVGYTYYVDLTPSADEILNNFSKSRRRNIEKNIDKEYEIEKGEEEAIDFIYEKIQSRYEAQGRNYGLDLDYFHDLNSNLSSDEFIPYIATIEGEYASGIIIINHGNKINYWQGGGKVDIDLPINDLIHWEIINDFKEKGVEKYDLTGANTPRICKYKARFNPELVPYHQIKRNKWYMKVAENIYKKFRK